MPEKRRTRTTGSQVKAQRTTTQTTLKDLFRTVPARKKQDVPPQHTDTLASSFQSVDAHPSQLFPIFTKVASVRERPREVITVDDTEVIDITDASSDIELSTESPLLSVHHLSHPSSSQAASHSPPPSSTHSNIHCCGDTGSSHASTFGHTRPRETGKRKESNERIVGSGDVAPLPSSYSQHVRGVQRSFTSSQAPPKRSVLPAASPSEEDFLTKRQQLDDSPSISFDRIQRSLTPQQCEKYLRSLGRDCTEAHPAFARISVEPERISLRHAEMWTRRFRPRRANEVLGNERHALYLRDWFRALELQMRGCQAEEAATRGSTAGEKKEKGGSRKAERRGVKRPRVVRTVAKKRGSKKRRLDSDDDLDDFVVFSDADEERAAEDSEDELAFCQRTLTRLHRHDTEDVHPAPDTETKEGISRMQELAWSDFADGLTNTVLITGPSGCGKTAAVYACAEELGWDVLEVYPGIGRRNGASVERLIGEVGRNHMVQTVDRGTGVKTTKLEGKEGSGLGVYLSKKGERGDMMMGGDVERERARDETAPDGEKEIAEGTGISGKWHGGSDGSRAIVRQSVVLLEEVDVLFEEDGGFWPAVVEFIGSCQRPVVMTCNDPGLVPVGDLPLQRVLVFEPCPSTVAATFLQCVSLTEGCLVPHEDLMALYEGRDAIRGLEVPEGLIYPRAEYPDLRRSITQLQMLCAGARHGSAREMQGGGRRSGGAISAETREWWLQMKRDSEAMSRVDAELEGTMIAEEAVRRSRGIHVVGSDTEASIKARTRVALEGLVVEGVPQRSVFLDYIPWMRHMVAVDDELERRALCSSLRATRNSLRTVHARTIVVVDAVAVSLLRECRLAV